MTAQMSVRIPLALKFSLAHSILTGLGVFFVIINNKNLNTSFAYEEELLHLTLSR